MKQEKGKAAFESVDEVLAEKIVKNSRDHGEKTAETGEMAADDVAAPEAKHHSSATKWFIALAIAAIVALAGCLFFGKCKRYWRG
jgi:hypothetical protein